MRTRDVTPVLKALGWKAYTDEVGDKYTHNELSDRVVEIIYSVRRGLDHQDFRAMLSVSTDAFSIAYKRIDNETGTYAPLIVAWKGLDIRASEILEDHVRQASEEAIAWAKEQDLAAGLQKHAALPTTAPGTGPVLHLAALAVLRDVTKLKSYQASWAAGDRLGFVPYVTKDYIDRAVSLAEEFVTGA